MTQLQITLPQPAQRFVDEQVATGRYGSASDYVAELVEHARIKAAQDKLAELIREGMKSGVGVEVTDEYWEDFDKKLKAELARRQSA